MDNPASECFSSAQMLIREQTYKVIRELELKKKGGEKELKIISKLFCDSEDIQFCTQIVYNLPFSFQSKWDILKFLIFSKYLNINKLPEFISDELLACSNDQNWAVRCSSLVILFSTTESSAPRASQLLYKGLCSPSSAVRSNVQRSWLSRIICFRSSKLCINSLLEKCRDEIVGFNKKPIFPIEFRELQGITCIDLEWKDKFEYESYPSYYFAYITYFTIFLATKGSGSQIKLDLTFDDIMENGLQSCFSSIRLLAYSACQKYGLHSDLLETCLISDLRGEISDSVMEIVDENMMAKFTEKNKEILENQRTIQIAERSKMTKSYPVNNEKSISFNFSFDDLHQLNSSLDKFLRYLGSTPYPSVASSMESLKMQNIDERSYVENSTIFIDSCVTQFYNNAISTSNIASLIFKMISQCPLRAVVDYGGDVIKRISKTNDEFREEIFNLASHLLQTDEKNTRALTFEVCFIATILEDNLKFRKIWEICKNLKNIEKKQIMLEMMANVVKNSSTKVELQIQKDILIFSLGLRVNPEKIVSTQLFEAVSTKMLEISNEVERIPLFVIIAKIPGFLNLVSEIISSPLQYFNKKSLHLTLYLISRISMADIDLYTNAEYETIYKMYKFAFFVFLRYENEKIMVSASVDAICSLSNWSVLRNEVYGIFDTNSEMWNRIRPYLHYNYYWAIFRETVNQVSKVSKEDLKHLRVNDLLSSVFLKDRSEMEMLKKYSNSMIFHERYACAFAFSIFCEYNGSFEDYEEIKGIARNLLKKSENPSEEEGIVCWISRGLCKMGIANAIENRDNLLNLCTGSSQKNI